MSQGSESMERGTLLAGILLLAASVQFGLELPGVAIALVGAVLVGAGGALLWVQLSFPHRRLWLPACVLGATVLLSTLVVQFAFRAEPLQWLAPLLAAASALVIVAFRSHSTARCGLCNRRLKLQAVTFRCPRCSLLVCDESCWSFEHRRCTMCLENRVPILPVSDSWWNRTAGPKSTQGRCQVCLAAADHTDLRPCPRCRRLQCRDCWDFSNGECTRCGESLPGLPESLGSVVAETR